MEKRVPSHYGWVLHLAFQPCFPLMIVPATESSPKDENEVIQVGTKGWAAHDGRAPDDDEALALREEQVAVCQGKALELSISVVEHDL